MNNSLEKTKSRGYPIDLSERAVLSRQATPEKCSKYDIKEGDIVEVDIPKGSENILQALVLSRYHADTFIILDSTGDRWHVSRDRLTFVTKARVSLRELEVIYFDRILPRSLEEIFETF